MFSCLPSHLIFQWFNKVYNAIYNVFQFVTDSGRPNKIIQNLAFITSIKKPNDTEYRAVFYNIDKNEEYLCKNIRTKVFIVLYLNNEIFT